MKNQQSRKPQLPTPVRPDRRMPVPGEKAADRPLALSRIESWPAGAWLRRTIGGRRVLMISGVAVALAAVLVVGANVLFSSDRVAANLAAHLEDRTGYRLVVGGVTRLQLVPHPRLVIADAKITPPAGSAGFGDLAIAELTVDLRFSDMFGDALDAKRVVLDRPVLTVGASQNANARDWNDARAPKIVRFARAQAGGAEPSRDLRIEDLRIVGGTVVLAGPDAAAEPRRIERIDAALTVPSLSAPLLGRGTFQWKRVAADFSFELATPADLRDTGRGALQAALDTPSVAARFDGSVTAPPHLAATGRLSAKAHSLPAVVSWLLRETDLRPASGDAEFDSLIDWTEDRIDLKEIRFAAAYAQGAGEAVVTFGQKRPHIRGALALDTLDLSRALGSADTENVQVLDAVPHVETASAPAPAANGNWFSNPEPASPGGRPPALSLAQRMPEAALPRTTPPQPQPQADPGPAPFDADINLNVREARLGQLDIGPSALVFDFRDGILKASLSGMALYDGDATGTLNIDTTKYVPQFDGRFRFEGVQARPLLTDAAQFELIAGRTKFTLSLSGEGGNADAIKSSLKGNGAFVVTDGAIEGIDITAFIRALGEGRLDLQQAPSAKTDFGDLSGSFTIDGGVAHTKNLNMQSPLLKVSAAGDVNLRTGTMQILATPEITAGPEGGKGANDLAGLSVPVHIDGPLDSPRIRPQVGAVFANPDNASRAVSKIGAALQKKFKGKQVGDFIGRLLSGANAGQAAPQALAPPQPAAPQD